MKEAGTARCAALPSTLLLCRGNASHRGGVGRGCGVGRGLGVTLGVALGVAVAVAVGVAVAVAVAVGVGEDVGVGVGPAPEAQYLPPVFKSLPPPQTIISVPVDTAL
jgi:hypothetical protein